MNITIKQIKNLLNNKNFTYCNIIYETYTTLDNFNMFKKMSEKFFISDDIFNELIENYFCYVPINHKLQHFLLLYDYCDLVEKFLNSVNNERLYKIGCIMCCIILDFCSYEKKDLTCFKKFYNKLYNLSNLSPKSFEILNSAISSANNKDLLFATFNSIAT